MICRYIQYSILWSIYVQLRIPQILYVGSLQSPHTGLTKGQHTVSLQGQGQHTQVSKYCRFKTGTANIWGNTGVMQLIHTVGSTQGVQDKSGERFNIVPIVSALGQLWVQYGSA